MKDLAAKFQLAAVNTPQAEYYNNTADNDKDGIPNWLEDESNEIAANYLFYNQTLF